MKLEGRKISKIKDQKQKLQIKYQREKERIYDLRFHFEN